MNDIGYSIRRVLDAIAPEIIEWHATTEPDTVHVVLGDETTIQITAKVAPDAPTLPDGASQHETPLDVV
jgi:hypothetical protein